jgi:hypothetical protein
MQLVLAKGALQYMSCTDLGDYLLATVRFAQLSTSGQQASLCSVSLARTARPLLSSAEHAHGGREAKQGSQEPEARPCRHDASEQVS